jgi:predicted RNase H-like HicB family nuclease
MEYTIEIYYDPDHGYFAKVLDLPGCIQYGDTLLEVLIYLVDAIQLYLSDL